MVQLGWGVAPRGKVFNHWQSPNAKLHHGVLPQIRRRSWKVGATLPGRNAGHLLYPGPTFCSLAALVTREILLICVIILLTHVFQLGQQSAP